MSFIGQLLSRRQMRRDLMVAVVVFLAMIVPSRRARRIEPLEALKGE